MQTPLAMNPAAVTDTIVRITGMFLLANLGCGAVTRTADSPNTMIATLE